MRSFWMRLGATVKSLTPVEHDQILSYISHLPHLLAYGLVACTPNQCFEYTSTGFKGTTRIAASDPEMWTDICMSNADEISEAIVALRNDLDEFGLYLNEGEYERIFELFQSAKQVRDSRNQERSNG